MMNRSFFGALIPVIAFVLILAGCAQMQIPGGGPRDNSPPKVIKYLPDSGARNFSGTGFRIQFDEFISLRDVSGNLIVSPPLEKNPDVKILKGKTLAVDFNSPLKPNTTYSFYFGNAIADIREGNVQENFRFVFSTGNYLDSNTISGRVSDALTQEAGKGFKVMLFSNPPDADFQNLKPDYMTKSGPDGSYSLKHTRPGKYFVLALEDKNDDFNYLPGSERVAFSDQLPDTGVNRILNLMYFTELPRKTFASSSGLVSSGHYRWTFSRPLGKPDFVFPGIKPSKDTFLLNAGRDTLDYFFKTPASDFFNVIIKEPTADYLDTFRIFFEKTAASKKEISFSLQPVFSSPDLKQSFFSPIVLKSPAPIAGWHFDGEIPEVIWSDKRALHEDALSFEIGVREIKLGLENAKGGFPWEPEIDYNLTLLPGIFTDFFGRTNDTLHLKFSTDAPEKYGTMKWTLELPTGKNFIFQILGPSGNVVHSGKAGSAWKSGYLKPGSYRARLIEDTNDNGVWDPGDVVLRKQPENTIYFPGKIQIRADWDHEEKWKPSGF
jgi:hypothetical protein